MKKAKEANTHLMECRSSSLGGCWCRAPWLWWCWSWWWWWPRCCCCCTSPHSRFIFNPCSAHRELFLTNLFFFFTKLKNVRLQMLDGELCCSDGGAGKLLSPKASGVANIRSHHHRTHLSTSRPTRAAAERQLPPRHPIPASRPAALRWRLLGKRFASRVVFHHQPSHGGFHPSLPACTADPAFALFSSGRWITSLLQWPSSLTGHLEPG